MSDLAPALWTIHCDGTALPNPGRIGMGAVLCAPDGTRHELSLAQGQGCNNEAEARAMLMALQEVLRLGATALCVYSDSRVLIDHLNGIVLTRVARLSALFDEVLTALQGFSHYEVRWLPQQRNAAADALARAALGMPVRAAPRPSRRRHR